MCVRRCSAEEAGPVSTREGAAGGGRGWEQHAAEDEEEAGDVDQGVKNGLCIILMSFGSRCEE